VYHEKIGGYIALCRLGGGGVDDTLLVAPCPRHTPKLCLMPQ
jgi:hypothetical protein